MKTVQTHNTFEIIGRECFSKKRPAWAESHSSRVIRLLERDIFPWLGTIPIGEITAPAILSVLRRIEGRGAVDTSHRARFNIFG